MRSISGLRPLPDAVRRAFSRRPAGYLNTATVGLPPDGVAEEIADFVDRWTTGDVDLAEWDRPVQRCRKLIAELVSVPVSWVSVGANVSVVAGAVAASVPQGAKVVVPNQEFTSVLYPFLSAGSRNSFEVCSVALAAVSDAVDGRTAWIAASLVQASDGSLLDLDAVRDAACRHGARIMLDTTQAAGWLPFDASAIDVTVMGGYKWLLGAKGACYAVVAPGALTAVAPTAPGWYAAEDPLDALFGGPLRLAADARRLDTSPAWLSYVASFPGLELLAAVGIDQVYDHNLGLARRCRDALDLPPAKSAILSFPADRSVTSALSAAGVRFAVREDRVRLSFHLYNDEDDVDLAVATLAEVIDDR